MKRRNSRPCLGAVLLEVLLALALFVSAAAVMISALNASLGSLERQRLGLHGINLASSILAEIQLGIRPPISEAAKPMDPPWQDWSSEVIVAPMAGAELGQVDLQQVEVVVRHLDPPMVQRLGQVLPFVRDGVSKSPSNGGSPQGQGNP
jgi:hypothetical protein